MRTKFGAVIVAGSGKLGGHVFSKNRSGSYVRTKVTPSNPNTTYQAGARNRFSTISTGWKGISESNRQAWNSAVDGFKGTNIFGDVKTPSGFNLYQKLNNNLSVAGVAAISTPPLPVALPVIATGVLAAAHGGAIAVTFTSDPIITASVVAVFATAAISQGKSFVKSEFRFIGLMPAITTHVTTLTTLYNAKFGAVGAAGMKVFVKMMQISNVTGQAGIPVIYGAVIS